MLGVVFLCSQFSPIEIIVSNKFFYTYQRYRFLEFTFYPIVFFEVLGFENCQTGHALD